jgi:phosphatidylglycerophosphate synthase
LPLFVAWIVMRTTSSDRRPIAARQWRISQSLAHLLATMRVSPNAISLASIGFGVATGLALAATSILADLAPVLWILAAAFAVLRLTANMLDGMVAIETKTASRLGELFNEVPDRISDSATLIGLGYSLGGNIGLGYAAAMAAMFTAYVRAVGKAAGASQQFCGPMAKPQRMAVVFGVALLSAAVQTSWAPTAGLALIVAGSVTTAGRRLVRIAAQLRRGEP